MKADQVQWENGEAFGSILRREREARNITRRALAKSSLAIEREVADWEKGKTYPRPHHLSLLFKALPNLKKRVVEPASESQAAPLPKLSPTTVGGVIALKLREAAPQAEAAPFESRVEAIAKAAALEGGVVGPPVTLTLAGQKLVGGQVMNVFDVKVDSSAEESESANAPEPAPLPEPVRKGTEPVPSASSALASVLTATGVRIPFHVALLAMRQADGLRQEDLASLLDVEASSVGAWERNQTTPVEAHYAQLLKLWPALAEAEVPQARAIPKPVGNVGARKTDPGPAPPAPQLPPISRATPVHASVDTFARAKKIARALARVGPMDGALVAALRELHEQGCSIADVLEWVDEGGAA